MDNIVKVVSEPVPLLGSQKIKLLDGSTVTISVTPDGFALNNYLQTFKTADEQREAYNKWQSS